MGEKEKPVRYDMGDRSDMTAAIIEAVNSAPELGEGETVAFATLEETGGFAMYPGSESIIEEERRSVTGRVRQICRYPFFLLLRSSGMSEQRRACAKERLDALARWLAQDCQPPQLTTGRRFLGFAVQTPAYLYDQDGSRAETWSVALAARYENVYQK